jgi:hypothetical protein
VLFVITPGEKCEFDGLAKDGERLEVSVFSVPRCRFASDGISTSLQQVCSIHFFFVFLTPET